MGYHFSKTSRQRLDSCHIDLQRIFTEVLKEADITIVCGHRSQEDQQQAYIMGHSKLQYPQSKHNSLPAMAVDVAPYNKGINWKDERAFSVLAGRVLSITERLLREGVISHRVRWGGDWDQDGDTMDTTFLDLPHFELVKP